MVRIFSQFSGNAGESGRSMVEMLGVLAIIGVLSVGGVASYIYAMNKHRANEIIQGVKERAVIGSGQRMNDHEVDFREFPELIIDYTTSGRNTGLNGEKEFFSVDVADVPQAVCQNVLNMNWDWPSGVFVNGVREETCPAENSQMTFVFAADLSSKIAQEQDPCYGQGSCCITIPGTRQIRVGELLLNRTCKGSGENVCCSAATLGCRYGEDIEKYRPYQTTRATCGEDGVHKCLNDLSCVCKSCQNAQMVQNAACDCSCPSGYQASTCELGHSYQSDALKDVFGNTLCYQCTACAALPAQDSRCSYTLGTDANGCPTQTIGSCACDSGYTTNACVAGTTYQVDMKTLTDGTQCYKCAGCPQDETPPANKCSVARTEAGQNGCPSRTVYDEVPCACDSGYTTNACVAGTTYQVGMKTLTNGTQCYKCIGCPVSETLEEGKCGIAQTVAGENGCPDYETYPNVVDLDACHKCVNGHPQLKDSAKTLVSGNTCCEPSTTDSMKCKVACTGSGTACQECDDTTGEWKNKADGSNKQSDGQCCVGGVLGYDDTYCPQTFSCTGCNACQKCDTSTGQCVADTSKNGTISGSCSICKDGVLTGNRSACPNYPGEGTVYYHGYCYYGSCRYLISYCANAGCASFSSVGVGLCVDPQKGTWVTSAQHIVALRPACEKAAEEMNERFVKK